MPSVVTNTSNPQTVPRPDTLRRAHRVREAQGLVILKRQRPAHGARHYARTRLAQALAAFLHAWSKQYKSTEGV